MNRTIITLAFVLIYPLTAAALPGDKETASTDTYRSEKKVARLAKQLELNPDQTSKVASIFKEQQAKHEILREETRKRLQAVLSSDQLLKMDELKKNHHEKWQKCHSEPENQDKQSKG